MSYLDYLDSPEMQRAREFVRSRPHGNSGGEILLIGDCSVPVIESPAQMEVSVALLRAQVYRLLRDVSEEQA